MKNQFDLIIFDWDGTLINSIDWITQSLQQAALAYGFPIPEAQAAKDVIGLSIENAVLTLFPEANELTQVHLANSYRDHYSSKQLGRGDLFPGVYDMLVHLKQSGYQLAVATGKTRSGLQAALSATGTEDLFCMTRCADETASKPDPKMLLEIIEHTQTSHDRCLMVGDSVFDLQMALNIPIPAIAVTCGAQSAELLQQYQPLLCLEQPTELLNYI